MKIRPIRTPKDLDDAKAVLASLISANEQGEFDDDIEVLSSLIEQWERKVHPIDAPSAQAAIRFRMSQLGFQPRHLEPFIGSRGRVSEVLTGSRPLTLDMIRSLHEGLGIPYESLIQPRMSKREADEQLSFDGISDDKQPRSHVLHKRTLTLRAASKTNPSQLRAWQDLVLKEASKKKALPFFDRSSLDNDFLRRIALYSAVRNGVDLALRAMADNGIAFVVVENLKGTFLDGAAMLDASGRPIVALTLRFDRTDSFWFTLEHELAHLALHYDHLKQDRVAFVDDIEIRSMDRFEVEADRLARDSLIPPEFISAAEWGIGTTISDIRKVASRARVDVSIVAGRWQRDHDDYRRFARLIERDVVRASVMTSLP